MDTYSRGVLWSQFGAAIAMLEDAMIACPEELWGDRTQHIEFWYTAYHTLFWLDLYLSGTDTGFSPPYPFTLDEIDPAGILPDRVYTTTELLSYLEHCRDKCKSTIQTLTDEQARRPARIGWWKEQMSFSELLLYTMRHVQEHAGQLGLMVGQKTGSGPDWVGRAIEAEKAG